MFEEQRAISEVAHGEVGVQPQLTQTLSLFARFVDTPQSEREKTLSGDDHVGRKKLIVIIHTGSVRKMSGEERSKIRIRNPDNTQRKKREKEKQR